MITRFGMAPRRTDMTIDQFQHHWRTSHADAAGQIPGVLRYTQNHAIVEGGRYLFGYPGFDACSELDFTSVAAMDDGFRSETYRTLVRADEDDFVDKTRFSLVVTTPTVVVDAPPGDVKLVRLLRTHPSRNASDLIEALRGPVAESLEGLGGRYVVYEPVAEPHDGPPASFDAVATLWIGDRDDVDTTLASAAWTAADLALAGIASGSVMLAARTIEVV